MYFLTGEYEHQLDAKNRIRIPSKLKGKETKLFFTKGTDGCIFAFYEEVIMQKFAELEEMKISDENPRKGKRSFIYSVRQVDLDPQGRGVIPTELMQHAKIKKDVKVCGAGSWIEIWAKEVYDEYFASGGDDFDKNFNVLGI